ncbi:Aromatic-L-amino-acid decarboxylase [Aphelenchoides besseyi]|nr:Aromatic-L-amino-acid decarboxylase [Aphelenchoides besseyi]KAI6229265.1 Aromatic-L-amino-acid decarboxylase [Aphelenchoides besseyi]
MDPDAFRKHGKEMVDFIADYWETLADRKPMPDVQPGFMKNLIPDVPPETPSEWSEIFSELEPVVLSTNTNWHHPYFFAYYPTACSYPALLGDMLSSAIASIGFTWKSSPSMTELEMKMTDWLATAIGLPDCFRNSDPGPGAGIIQCTASDATFVAILAARSRIVAYLKSNPSQFEKLTNAVNNLHIKSAITNIFDSSSSIDSKDNGSVTTFDSHDGSYFNRLVVYCSEQAHCSVAKGIMLSGTKMRKIAANRNNPSKNYCIDVIALRQAIKEDRDRGLIPFILIATVGTTSTCAVDDLKAVGPVCEEEKIWLHVDAAYAGSYLLCPEFRGMIDGIEYVDSFNFNPHKAMMITFDCSPLWVKNATEASLHFNVDAEYLKHEHQTVATDYRHLQIALGRRFRALKVWFVMRALGLEQIRKFQRTQVKLANLFSQLITLDKRFELVVPPHLGLVCFRLIGDNRLTNDLLNALNADGRIHLVAAKVDEIFFLRLAICSAATDESHIEVAAKVISELADKIH